MTAATGFKRLGIAIAAVVLASFAALGAMSLLIPIDTRARGRQGRNPQCHRPRSRAARRCRGFAVPDRLDQLRQRHARRRRQAGAGGRPADRAAALLPAVRRPHRDRRRVAGAAAHQRDLRPRRPFQLGRLDRHTWRARSARRPTGRSTPPRSPRSASTTAPSRCRTPTRGINETFSDVELALAWPSISKSFAATGRVVWHDEPIDTTITLDGFRRGARRRPLRAEGSSHRRAAQVRLRGQLEHAADAEDRRHARRRRAIAARHASAGPASSRCPAAASAASRSRPRPTCRAARSRCRRSTSSSTATSPRAC